MVPVLCWLLVILSSCICILLVPWEDQKLQRDVPWWCWAFNGRFDQSYERCRADYGVPVAFLIELQQCFELLSWFKRVNIFQYTLGTATNVRLHKLTQCHWISKLTTKNLAHISLWIKSDPSPSPSVCRHEVSNQTVFLVLQGFLKSQTNASIELKVSFLE